jgi:hypothetical protein
MKLFLNVAPKEVFDTPRGTGLALIASGVATEYKEPTFNVVPDLTAVTWSISGDEFRYFLKADCGKCHHVTQMPKVEPFRHCARADNPPADLATRFTKLLKTVKPRKAKGMSVGERALARLLS